MSKTIEDRYDSTGQLIKLHDVLKDEETGEMVLVVYASNKSGVRGLAVENKMAGIRDWLDVYPDGVWTIVGNAETVAGNIHDNPELLQPQGENKLG